MPRDVLSDQSPALRLAQLCDALGIEVSVVAEHTELGLFQQREVAGPFTSEDAARLSRVLRLARDLEIHAAAAVLVVELLEERERLTRRVACLEHSLIARS